MANVGNEWTVVRTKDISGGFTPDPNWEQPQDVDAWLATDPLWHVPDYSKDGAGRIELLISFYNDPSNNVEASENARVDVQVIARVIAAGLPERLITLGQDRVVPGDSILEPIEKNYFPAQIAYRFVAVQDAPAANFMSLLARLV